MKVKKIAAILIGAAGLVSAVVAEQSTDYLIVQMPIGTVAADSVVWVKWVGKSSNPLSPLHPAPDSGFIYYNRSPGGGKLANYRNKVLKPFVDTTGGKLVLNDNIYEYAPPAVPKRGSAFIPAQQTDMAAGVFYCVVAYPLSSGADTLVSNEFKVLVESKSPVKLVSPSGKITELTPTFQWEANPGVPYYHVILSDEPLSIDTTGSLKLEGLSIVWQAISSGTRIVYGSPDPSKTITADPPPLSPGSSYTWVVLNNYGNHPAFSSYKSVSMPPGVFSLTGQELKRPKNVYPNSVNLTSIANKNFSFKWTTIDTNANTYKIYVYVTADMGEDFEGVNAKMTVWQKEVRATREDTMSVEIDALSILTSNRYTWRVLAIDAKGAGTAGDTTSFRYSADTGVMKMYTRENIPVLNNGKLDTVVSEVGLVQAKVEVLDGSMEAPLLFYTDTKGQLSRTRPVGSYRVTMVKEGFENLSKTIVLARDSTTVDTFYLERPESQIYGKVVDESNKGINLATVWGISDRSDTIIAKTDGLGNFVLNCYGADWQVRFEMAGYKPVLPKKITVVPGESYGFGAVTMLKNPYTLSGVVKNTSKQPVLGARVRLYRDGVQLDEVPATPQAGSFSFSVPAGTYTLKVEKVGFTSYNDSLQVVNTRDVTVVLAPRATLVSGFVYGKTYLGADSMIAPVTGAGITFVRVGTSDTVRGTFDPVYGNYTASLPGSSRFVVRSSATGYAVKFRNDTLFTGSKANVTVNDTLLGFAMVPGMARLSSTGAMLGNVSVNLVHVLTNTIAVTARSAANGYFELRSIGDGTYLILAGKDEFMLDSIQGADTLVVVNGKPGMPSVNVFMKAGDKTIKWVVLGTPGPGGSIKIQSPIQKTIGITDTLANAGPQTYIISVDASPDTVVDMSYHRFTIPDPAAVYIDTVTMDVLHHHLDTLTPVNDQVVLAVRASDSLDSAAIFFKDADGASWQSVVKIGRALEVSFAIIPPRDGSKLQYYFKVWRGGDVYGYDKEFWYSYVMPNLGRLTKFEIVPYSADTLRFPAKSDITFVFRGYYSSSFIRAEIPDAVANGALTWSLTGATGCTATPLSGGSTVLSTTETPIVSPAVLTLTIDTARIKIKPEMPRQISVRFIATGSPLKAINVKRVDALDAKPISTSLADKAEFIAEGVDAAGTLLTLSPKWSVEPSAAGAISQDGTFKPDSKFIGYARVFAKTGKIRGEYTTGVPAAQPGINVINLISRKSIYDTISNGNGVSLVFPPNIVNQGDIGQIQLSIPSTVNLVRRGLVIGNVESYRMVDSNAWEFNELTKVAFTLGAGDSMRLSMNIPGPLTSSAASGKRKFYLACWNTDSLRWDVQKNSMVSADGQTVTAGITHFSTYAIVSTPPMLAVDFSVSPNPFSPKVRPSGAEEMGTRFLVKAETPQTNLQYFEIRIFNLLGDMVWGVQLKNAQPKTYSVWWDGTATDRVENIGDATMTKIVVKGKYLCRNGRYFAVLVVRDYNNKETKYMKQVILIK